MLSYLYIILYLFIGLCQSTQAQSTIYNLDSLFVELKNSHDDSPDRFLTLVNIANAYVYFKLDSAAHYLNLALEMPKKGFKPSPDFYRHWMVKAWICQGNEKYSCAREYYSKAREILLLSHQPKKLNELDINLASLLVYSKDSSAFNFVSELKANADTTLAYKKETWVVSNYFLSQLAFDRYEYETAINMLLALLEDPVLTKVFGYRDAIFNSLSIYLKEIEDYDNAIHYVKKALRTVGLQETERKLLLGNIADIYLRDYKPDSAKVYIQKFKEMDGFNLFDCELLYSCKSRIALQEKKYREALVWINKTDSCLSLMQSPHKQLQSQVRRIFALNQLKLFPVAIQVVQEIRSTHGVGEKLNKEIWQSFKFQELYASIGWKNPDLLPLLKEYYDVSNDYHKGIVKKQLKEVTRKYEVESTQRILEKQKNELIHQELEISKRKNQNFLLGILGLVLLIIVALVWNRSIRRKRKSKRVMQSIHELRERNKLLIKEINDKSIKAPSLEDIAAKSITFSNSQVVLLGKITHLQKSGDMVFVFVEELEKKIVEWGTLKGYVSDVFCNPLFVRINQSLVVNLKYITKYSGSKIEIKKDEKILEFRFGRTFKKEALKLLEDHLPNLRKAI